MKFNPQKFNNISINTYEQSQCSPAEPGPEWKGIIINAPEEMTFTERQESILLPICGYYRLDMKSLSKSEGLKLNIFKKGSDKMVSGFILEKDPNPQAPEPFSTEVAEEETKDLALGGYFNSNLLDYVDIELETGEYEVYVEDGGMKSNTVIIKVEIKKNSLDDSTDDNIEKFNIKQFEENKIDKQYSFNLPDGSQVKQSENSKEYYVERIKKGNTPFESYKEFYFDSGILMTKGELFYNFPIGIWYKYDKNGKILEKVNHDTSYKFTIYDLDKKLKEMEIDIMDIESKIFVSRNDKPYPYYQVFYPIIGSNNEVIVLVVNGTTGEIIKKEKTIKNLE